MNDLKELIDNNKVKYQVSLFSKWYKSNNATLQMGAMKLVCTPEQRKMLSMQHIDHTTNDKEINEVKLIIIECGNTNDQDSPAD
jgi:pyruvate/2-oxoglutarate dehydrogenase complex dihydrolipoamide dehydrogenase (E3) component